MRIWAEINLDNLKHNLKSIEELLTKEKIIATVKADAYGHGDVEITKILMNTGIKDFSVASISEADNILNNLENKDINIHVLGPNPIEDIENYNEKMILSLCSFEEIEIYEKLDFRIKVNIIFDTGMGRVGFHPSEADKLAKSIQKFKNIEIVSIMSHLSSADDSEDYTLKQLLQFENILEYFPDIKKRHILNSYGILNYKSNYEYARPGIILYGSINMNHKYFSKFKPVMSVKSKITLIKIMKEEGYISYNRTYKAKKDEKIATISAGYADGVRRDLSNNGEVFIKGKRFPIVGRVCMDQLMISVPIDFNINVGDEVEIFGSNINVEEVANRCNTISYEILCGISKRVKRIYV